MCMLYRGLVFNRQHWREKANSKQLLLWGGEIFCLLTFSCLVGALGISWAKYYCRYEKETRMLQATHNFISTAKKAPSGLISTEWDAGPCGLEWRAPPPQHINMLMSLGIQDSAPIRHWSLSQTLRSIIQLRERKSHLWRLALLKS